MFLPPRYALASERVAFVGDAVAMVVAETHEQARDAAELVEVDYEERPSNVETVAAMEASTPPVWEECQDNVCFYLEMGEREAVERAFADAAHVVRFDVPISRVGINPMEPRACVGDYSPADDTSTLHTSTQNPHGIRTLLAQAVLRIPEARLRVIARDVGGGFGNRTLPYPEDALVLVGGWRWVFPAGLLAMLGHQLTLPVALLATPTALLLTGPLYRARSERHRGIPSLPWRPRSVLGALLHRDLVDLFVRSAAVDDAALGHLRHVSGASG